MLRSWADGLKAIDSEVLARLAAILLAWKGGPRVTEASGAKADYVKFLETAGLNRQWEQTAAPRQRDKFEAFITSVMDEHNMGDTPDDYDKSPQEEGGSVGRST